MVARLPDDLYIEIFKRTGENPMRFRVCKYFQRIIFDLYPFGDDISSRVLRMLIWFNRHDLLQSFKYIHDYDEYHPIIHASKIGCPKILKILLSNNKLDPSSLDNSAISVASEFGNLESVRLLLSDPRVDPSGGDNRALWGALHYGYIEVSNLLMKDPRVIKTESDRRSQTYYGSHAIMIGHHIASETAYGYINSDIIDSSHYGRNAMVNYLLSVQKKEKRFQMTPMNQKRNQPRQQKLHNYRGITGISKKFQKR